MLERPIYLDRLAALDAPDVIKVITGVRRCGKSTLLNLQRERLLTAGVPAEKIVTVDFEAPSNWELTKESAFVERVSSAASGHGATHLFVDEVQELENWPRAINGLRAEHGLDVFVTGSNARMFAGEAATYLSGRYVELEVYPLSFTEYLNFTGASADTRPEIAYEAYRTEGGFPAVALAPNESLGRALLDGIYDSVFMRDVILRGKVRNEAAFMRVAAFVLDNIGSQTSANAIAKALAAGGHKTNPETVDNYLALMCDAFLLYRCERFDIRGKERLRTNGKYYAVDPGLRARALGAAPGNLGHVTENMVFLELKRRGYDVFVGTLPGCEIDFVALSGGDRRYIQVSETVADPATLDRELAPFAKLRDGYRRILITKDVQDCSRDGIEHINFYDFLLGKEI